MLSYKTIDELLQESPYRRIQTKNGKWNLVHKENPMILSDVWFDNLIFSGSHISNGKQADDIYIGMV